jgi:hypothetical protein
LQWFADLMMRLPRTIPEGKYRLKATIDTEQNKAVQLYSSYRLSYQHQKIEHGIGKAKTR